MSERFFAGKKILVTGGMGFIGSNLCRRLVEEGGQVIALDNLYPDFGGNRFNLAGYEDRLRIVIGDLRDEKVVNELVPDCDFIFHLAGQTSHMDSMREPLNDLDINARGTVILLEAGRKSNPACKIVLASTRQVYGTAQYLPVDEKHPCHPPDVNGINKMACEQYHLLYHSVHGIRSSLLRLTNTIGPGMRIKDARQTFLGIWIRLLAEGKPFEVWDGVQLRDFTYVDDAVDAFLIAAQCPEADGEIFNLGGERSITLNDLAKELVEVAGGEFRVQEFPKERKKIDIGDYYADDRKIRRVLSWQPKVPLKEALVRTFAYYKTNLKHYI